MATVEEVDVRVVMGSFGRTAQVRCPCDRTHRIDRRTHPTVRFLGHVLVAEPKLATCEVLALRCVGCLAPYHESKLQMFGKQPRMRITRGEDVFLFELVTFANRYRCAEGSCSKPEPRVFSHILHRRHVFPKWENRKAHTYEA